MHRLILILCIALLPLRTWAGDLMAIQMAVSSAAAASASVAPSVAPNISTGITSSMTTGVDAPTLSPDFECAEHAHGVAAAAPSVDHCSTCVTCQICHSMAMVTVFVGTAGQTFRSAPPAQGILIFSSAERALSQKPPIS